MTSVIDSSWSMQVDQMTSELASERNNAQKLESERSQLDRQNKDLKNKLAELEQSMKVKIKNVSQTFESKIAGIEEQLEVESRLVD